MAVGDHEIQGQTLSAQQNNMSKTLESSSNHSVNWRLQQVTGRQDHA